MGDVEKWVESVAENKTGNKKRNGNIINPDSTPLSRIEQMFLSEQEGRGNTRKTIKYYKGVWAKLYQFLLFDSGINDETVDVIRKVPFIVLGMSDIQKKYRAYMKTALGNSEQTVQSHMRGVRAVMKYITSNGWLDTPHIVVNDDDPPIKMTFTESELETLSRKPSVDDFIEYRAWIITRYTMATGNRAGSIASIKVGDIDFEEGFVNINTVKNKTPIRLPLVRSILKELREYVSLYRTDTSGTPLYNEYLFVNQYGEQLDADGVGRIFRIYCRNRGIAHNSIHLLRHTFAKYYMTGGGDVLSLKTMLGHKSLKMVNHYARLYGTDIKDMVEEHSLINQTKVISGRKKLTKR